MLTIKELSEQYIARLEAVGVHTPVADTRTIFARVLNIPMEKVEGQATRPVSAEEQAALEAAIAQREKRIPLSRIFNATAFSGLQLQMTPGVFNIYPESEVMVDHALMSLPDPNAPLRILDVGTGSGCLLLALLHQLPNATGVGIDNSQTALKLARMNAESCGLADRAEFRTGNWADGVDEQFDLVVSNPPRVATKDIPFLTPEMRLHDPIMSLDGGPGGLKYFYLLAEALPRIAKPKALAFLQIGPRYGKSLQRLFIKAGFYPVELKKNYRGEASCVAVVNAKRPRRILDIFRWF